MIYLIQFLSSPFQMIQWGQEDQIKRKVEITETFVDESTSSDSESDQLIQHFYLVNIYSKIFFLTFV